MYLTLKQAETLLHFARKYSDTEWKIVEGETTDEHLCIRIHPGIVGADFDRYITPTGHIFRYDMDSDRMLPAGIVPLRDYLADGSGYNY